jgi:hypothetical protein
VFCVLEDDPMRLIKTTRFILGVGLAGLLGCEYKGGEGEQLTQVSGALESTNLGGALEVSLPDGLLLASAVIGANGQVTINDRARIEGASTGLGTVVNVGTGTSELGADAQLGDLFGGGAITLRDRAYVSRRVQAGSTITKQDGVTVLGGTAALAPLKPAQSRSWLATFAESAPNIVLTSGQIRTLSPGQYGDVTVNAGTRLNLGTGTYAFRSLKVEPQSTLSLSPGAGSVVINVRSELIFRGAVTDRANVASKVLVGYLGTAMAAVEAPFGGTMVAPNARIKVEGLNGAIHYGAFFGKDVEVHPGARVVHRPFVRWADVPLVNDGSDPLASVPATMSVLKSGTGSGYELRYLPVGALLLDVTNVPIRRVPALTGDVELVFGGTRCQPGSNESVLDCLEIPPASRTPIDGIIVRRLTFDPWALRDALGAILKHPFIPLQPLATLFKFEHMYVEVKLAMKFQTTPAAYDFSSEDIKTGYMWWSDDPNVIPNKHDFLTALNEAAVWLRSGDRFTNFRGQPTTAMTATGNGAETEDSDSTPRYFISYPEAWRLYIWWVAQNVALDMMDRLPWSLHDVTAGDLNNLAPLFDSTEMFHLRITGDVVVGGVGHPNYHGKPWASYLGSTILGTPRYTYRFLAQNGIVKNTPLASIEAMLEWAGDLAHFIGSGTRTNALAHWGHRYFPTVEKIIEGTVRTGESSPRHWTMGCHGTSQFIKDVLRAINIPVRVPFMCDHAQIAFPSEGVFVDHGDNPYSLRNAGSQCPASHLFLEEGRFLELYGQSVNHDDPEICDGEPNPVGYQVATGLELCE